MPETPAERLGRFIEAKRLRKSKVATTIGCSRQWLHAIINDGRPPSLEVAVAIEDLMVREGAEKPIDPREWVTSPADPAPKPTEAPTEGAAA